MYRNLDATILIEHQSEIEYRDGLFYVTDLFGSGSKISRCYTPSVFFGSMRAANCAIAQWTAEQRIAAENVASFERVYPESKSA